MTQAMELVRAYLTSHNLSSEYFEQIAKVNSMG